MQALCQFASTLCLSLSAMAFVLAADTRIARATITQSIRRTLHLPEQGRCAGSSSSLTAPARPWWDMLQSLRVAYDVGPDLSRLCRRPATTAKSQRRRCRRSLLG